MAIKQQLQVTNCFQSREELSRKPCNSQHKRDMIGKVGQRLADFYQLLFKKCRLCATAAVLHV